MVSTGAGWAFVAVGTLFWGVFGLPIKAKSVQGAQMHSIVFQLYMSVAIFVSSCLLLPLTHFAWTWWGVASGFLWVSGNICAITAVNKSGLAASQGLWGGIICIVSFLWGYFAQPLWADTKCELENTALAVLGLALLICGIGGIAFVSKRSSDAHSAEFRERLLPIQSRPSSHTIAEQEDEIISTTIINSGSNSFSGQSDDAPKSPNQHATGLMFAVGCGVLAGSVLVPSKLAPKHASDLAFTFSFATGILLASVLFFVVASVLPHSPGALSLHLDMRISPFCLLSGVLWNVGNVSSVMATNSPLGLTIAYPLMQNAMVISGVVGIVFLKEITGRTYIIQFAIAVVVISVGAFFLGRYGACKV
eukprot:c52705_g1_i1.p1 GENE.c52705_g1_i1~~c52705_g1_i1.p1  ORF type:complete len:373 (-),score=67.89 c52705_g1_i1:41-1129(-)